MKNFLRLLLITLPLAAIGAVVLIFVVSTSPPPTQIEIKERATTVRAIIAQNQPVPPKVSGFGIVSPAHTFEAIAQVAGTVDYVNPELLKGGSLAQGAVLLRLSAEDFNLAIAQARANIRAAQAKLNELAVSEQNQTDALAIEKEALDLKAAELERTEKLFSGGTVSQVQLDAVRAAHLAQRQKVLSIQSALALLPTQRDVQLEQIAVYQSSLETAELNLERTELTVPFAARVASVSVEVGQFVKSGQTTAILDGIGTAEVEALVSMSELRTLIRATRPDAANFAADPAQMTQVLRGLNLSANVALSLGSETTEWPATVDRISETVDTKTGMIGVILQIDNTYSGGQPGERPPLTKGMFVQATLSGTPITGIVVPRTSLRNGQLQIVDDENRLELLPATPAMIQDGFSVLTSGLDEGTRVVVSDLGSVIPGMLLDVTVDEKLMSEIAAFGQTQ